MSTKAKILIFDHDNTSIEGIAANKEETLNQAFEELEEAGNTIIHISETVVNSHYTMPYNSTLVTILYRSSKDSNE